MMNSQRWQHRAKAIAATAAWIVVVGGPPAAAAVWALGARSVDWQAPVVKAEPRHPESSRPRSVDLPALDSRILGVTLVDELFPLSPQPLPPPPAPELGLKLIAITRSGAVERIFVKDQVSESYLDMAIGDRTPRGATLLAIDEAGALFEFSGDASSDVVTARLELEP